jgi:hypothetical protein
MEIDICELLNSMRLEVSHGKVSRALLLDHIKIVLTLPGARNWQTAQQQRHLQSTSATSSCQKIRVIKWVPLSCYIYHIPQISLPLQSDGGSDRSSSSSQCSNDETYGCAYLQTIRQQLDNFVTTSGEYLEAIFTHREILSSYPAAHRQCARGFSDIAYMLEQRAWRADREADTEAVTAFRHEAWAIAASL